MAGPTVESIIYHYGRGSDAEIYEWIVDELRQRRESAEEEPSDKPDDYSLAGPYVEDPLAVALTAVNPIGWILSSDIAGGCLTVQRSRGLGSSHRCCGRVADR